MAYSVSFFLSNKSFLSNKTFADFVKSVRVQFEIGHEASVRTKKTPEGFTHDWEVFVRGAENTDIQCFVDKVVFHLHETFPKPRRVIKEPPYVVKESGYAGFVLPIDVYLKNKEEPKKINFQYDLQLQPSGPPISRVLREPRLFQNPSEDFRRKLIRGGGVGVDTPSDSPADDFKSLSGASKGKLTESPNKRHKGENLNSNDSFAELFGTPIRRVLDPKKALDGGKKLSDSDFLKNKKKIGKYDSYKEEKEFCKEKERNLERERNKEREKNKEKQSKRPQSPISFGLSLQSSKSKDEYKKHEERKKEEYEEKKRKKEEGDKKEKIKEIKDVNKQCQERENKKEKKDLEQGKKSNLMKSFDIKTNYDKHNEFLEKEKHKHRHKKKDKDRNKEREKQKKKEMKEDKFEKEIKEKEKDKSGKKKHEGGREKEEKCRRKSISPSPATEPPKKKPLNALLDELGSSDSMSPLSDNDSPSPIFKPLTKSGTKTVVDPKTHMSPSVVTTKLISTNYGIAYDTKQDKDANKFFKLEKSNLGRNKKEKSSSKKNKKLRENSEKGKIQKEERRPHSPSSEKEEDSGDRTKVIDKERSEEEKQERAARERDNKKRKRDRSEDKQRKVKKSGTLDGSGIDLTRSLDFSEGGNGGGGGGGDDAKKSDRFTKEYVAQLKDLQHRIMTLEDNAELQKVVKVIAETGQYEITKKTFDFDLCALDSDTVKRLQDFFLPT